MRIGGEALREMQRHRQRGAADSAEPPSRLAPGIENGHVETILQGASEAASMRSRNQRYAVQQRR
uniref:Uncharacterized protein n=1 Tax=Streptomyces avermitilis TaxID=33903 RepID=A0A499V4C9_STRAX|nr:hypothetical protein SAVMC3_19740 [Streptomyces avermitilis]